MITPSICKKKSGAVRHPFGIFPQEHEQLCPPPLSLTSLLLCTLHTHLVDNSACSRDIIGTIRLLYPLVIRIETPQVCKCNSCHTNDSFLLHAWPTHVCKLLPRPATVPGIPLTYTASLQGLSHSHPVDTLIVLPEAVLYFCPLSSCDLWMACPTMICLPSSCQLEV